MTDYFTVSDSDSMELLIVDISCILLPYDISFLSCPIIPNDLSCNIIDISCNSATWFSFDVSFILLDISEPNIISMDISYALENNRMVFFSHESTIHSLENS